MVSRRKKKVVAAWRHALAKRAERRFLRLAAAVIIMTLIGIVLAATCSGCAALKGAKPAVSLESDRSLLDHADANVTAALDAASQTGEHPVTARLLGGAKLAIEAVQDGAVGRPDQRAAVDPDALDAVHREFAGLPPADPAKVAALEAKLRDTEAALAATAAENRSVHGKLQAAGAAIATLAKESAGKFGAGTVATGGTGAVLMLLGAAWKYRRYAGALVKATGFAQKLKEAAEDRGVKLPVAEIAKEALAGHEAECGRAYHEVTGKEPSVVAPPGRIRKAARSLVAASGRARASASSGVKTVARRAAETARRAREALLRKKAAKTKKRR